MQRKIILFVIIILLLGHQSTTAQNDNAPVFAGITMVAPPSPISNTELKAINAVKANWVALVPYGYSSEGNPSIRYNLDRQWWGERQEGIEASIDLAHAEGLSVMLKPQVYIHGGWVGDVQFDTDEQWQEWEANYRTYILFYAEIAARKEVELLCIGTEWKRVVAERPQFWSKLIADLRQLYSGKLIYCSNWDGYEKVPFWKELDYVGISSYFPLSDRTTPTVHQLKAKWQPIKKQLRKFHKEVDKQIIFAEYGYMSIDGCAGKAWLIEKDLANRSINQVAQARAYDALWSAHWDEDYWAGGFLWKWFPAGMGHEGYPEKDYTPQDKVAYDTILKWHSKVNRQD